MKPAMRGVALVALALALGATGLAAPSPSAGAPITAAAPSASSSAAVAPTPPVIHGADIPAEESRAPTAAEWSSGKPVAPTRGSAEHCELTLLREWLKIRCPGMVGAGLVAGEPRGVTARVVGRLFTDDGMPGDVSATVVLPLRRGEARIVSFGDSASEYNGSALVEGGILSVLWRMNRADPVLVMSGFPKQPGQSGPGFGPE